MTASHLPPGKAEQYCDLSGLVEWLKKLEDAVRRETISAGLPRDAA